jgi:hypothetical protein
MLEVLKCLRNLTDALSNGGPCLAHSTVSCVRGFFRRAALARPNGI